MSRELVAAASVMLTMVLVLLFKVSSWSYAMYSVMSLPRKVHSLCCKRNDDTGIFLVFLLVGS